MKLAAFAVLLVPSVLLAEENEVTFVNVPTPNAETMIIDQPHNPKIRASTRPPVRRLPQLISNGRATQSLPVTQRADACCRGLQK